MSDRIAQVEAELVVLKAEAAFVAKKQAGEATMEDRLALRAIREDWRLNHRKRAANGAAPAVIGAEGEVD